MKNDILLIYPQDATTDFLQGIPDFLFDRHGKQRFIFNRVDFTEESHRDCRLCIEQMPLNSFIIFIGHGSSQALIGARSSISQESILINRNQISLFKGQTVFFLSCRSSDLLKNQGIPGIGFGDIITDMSEILSRREHEIEAYRYSKGDITEEDIYHSNKLLVDVVRYSLNDAITEGLSISEIYFRLKLRFNKNIFNVIRENKSLHARWVSNLLLEIKTEMKLFLK